jgi:hypothetical protein
MKWWAGIFLLLLTGLVQAQKQGANFGAIDWQVQSVKGGTPDTLAYNLTAPYPTDMEKVRAIYSWICANIAYNANIYKPYSLRPRFVQEPVDTTREWKSADEMVAQKVLKRGLAVCEGYAKLFKVLCHYAGIEAVILHGYVRTDYDRSTERFRTNHTWNAVRIDSTWHLLDVTWAAGYMNYRDEFVQQQNDFYFLTPPDVLIRDHYPEDLRWTLLAQPPTVSEFKKMPFKSKCFIKYGITAYFPSHGLLEALPGDTLSFQIDLRDVNKAKNTFGDPFLDTAIFTAWPNSAFLKPVKETGNKVYYQLVIDATTQWVHLLFNDDVILRYNVSRRQVLAGN